LLVGIVSEWPGIVPEWPGIGAVLLGIGAVLLGIGAGWPRIVGLLGIGFGGASREIGFEKIVEQMRQSLEGVESGVGIEGLQGTGVEWL